VAIDFRSKQPMSWWRNFWDISFSVSSILSTLLIGVALGNVAWGIPLDATGEFVGSFFGLLHPYALLVGITTVALFMMHGAIYVVMKTEGELQETIRRWVNPAIIFFVICYVATTMATLMYLPHMSENLKAFPVLWVLPLLNALAIANIPREIHHGRDFRAFLSSCCAMAALLALFGIGMYPNMILSSPVVENSLNIYNAASSPKTLKIMLIIAILGMPLVLAYTTSIYYIFRGKVKLDSSSY
jgi:cytochrome d ubiquinol oxidase subunit II